MRTSIRGSNKPEGTAGRTASRARRRTLLIVLLGAVLVALLVVIYLGWLNRPSEKDLVHEFAHFKNTNHPRAAELLNLFVIPDRPVSREEAERLDAESLLHQPFHVVEVRPLRTGQRFVLVAKGRLYTEPLPVEGLSEPQQRVLINPDIIVEVRDGKVHGIRAQLHID